VFRNNNLVAESYMKYPNDRTNPNAIWSCTKQVTALLTGIAIDQGLLFVSDPVSKYLSQAQNTNKSGITIENLLMMKSGIDFNNDGFNGETSQLLREEPSNSLNFILDLGMTATPGTYFNYNDGDPQIISAVLQERTGRTLRDWAKDVLFDKMGIDRLQWHMYKDGITMGAFGILTTPREMAKIGQLILNNGLWGNQRIVSDSWLNDMTSSKVLPDETHESNITFGYDWWGDSRREVQMMRGHGGQYVFVNKAKNLIVVITAEPNTQGDFQLSYEEGIAIYDRINTIAN
jgi:CubicO group peptidase (beta-lactamase class C family)